MKGKKTSEGAVKMQQQYSVKSKVCAYRSHRIEKEMWPDSKNQNAFVFMKKI